ncbi:MAG: carboxypeptidase-like regulatory domain-containing protein, partial [Planctomycetota bacterium]
DYRIAVRCDGRFGHRAFFILDTGDGDFNEITYRNSSKEPASVQRTPIHVTAKQQPWVRIKIIDDQGNPVSSGGVRAVDAQRHYGGSAAVGDDGIAILSVNNPGVHDVYYASDPIQPQLGCVDEVDIQLDGGRLVEMQIPATRKLSGRVVDSATSAPVPGVYVASSKGDPGDVKPRVTGAMAVSDRNGRFELPVTAGDWKLSIRHEVDGYFVPTYDARRNVEVEPELPSVTVASNSSPGDVVVKIARGLVVEGQLLDPQGRPARGVKVTATCENYPFRRAATTGSDGRFRLAGLSPHASVRVFAWSQSGAAETTVAATKDQPWDKTLTRRVELQLVPGTSVVGRVVRDERPASGVVVKLQRAPPEVVGEKGTRFAILSMTTTDDEGLYRLTGLMQGDRYRLEVEPQGGAQTRDWQFASPYFHTVEVENGETIELPDAELKTNGQTLSGRVVAPNGEPVAGVTVSGRYRSKAAALAGASTDDAPLPTAHSR